MPYRIERNPRVTLDLLGPMTVAFEFARSVYLIDDLRIILSSNDEKRRLIECFQRHCVKAEGYEVESADGNEVHDLMSMQDWKSRIPEEHQITAIRLISDCESLVGTDEA